MDAAKLQTAYATLGAYRGNIVVSRCGCLVPTSNDPTKKLDLASANKTITTMIAARLIQDGKITADTAVPYSNDAPTAAAQLGISEFSSGASASGKPLGTYRQFMTMTSDFGLAGYAPGTHYAYNNNAIHLLGTTMNRSHFGNVTPVAMLESALFSSIGGHQDSITYAGQFGGWGGGWAMTARDLARLGVLMLGGGVWNGTRLLPQWWVDGSYTNQLGSATVNLDRGSNTQWNQHSVTEDMRSGYSYGWWLQGQNRIAAEGRGGNFLIVLPDDKLVIAVVNDEPDRRPSASAYIAEIRKAIASSAPCSG